ncbi:PIN domain-containing protein [Arthrobacter sp. NPDC097144]|uniref:PIN domain-containing protein n=1 Tax=Arthrobacter sp. NPDC097144 TaxID=3363946 RepID=UPI00382B89DD
MITTLRGVIWQHRVALCISDSYGQPRSIQNLGDTEAVIFLVPDTNILATSPFLQAPAWNSVIENGKEWGVQILVPDVVLLEITNLVGKKWLQELQKLLSLRLGTFDVKDEVERIRDKMQERIQSFAADLTQRLEAVDAQVIEVPAVSHLVIAERASGRIAPYQGDTKDGYRDTLIWLTLLAAAEEHPDDEIWFVSDNTKDFGPSNPHWTGENQGSRNDCPINFHPQLHQELKDRGLAQRVKYAVSVEVLEQHLAAHHAPISDTELAALQKVIEIDALEDLLREGLSGRSVSASQAALTPSAERALILSTRSSDMDWFFNDAAGRGETYWAANYSVDVDVDLEVAPGSGNEAVVSKKLRVGGQVTLSRLGVPSTFDIASVQALPNDPGLAFWTTTARRRRLEAELKHYKATMETIEQFSSSEFSKVAGLDIGKLTGPAFDMTKIVGLDIGKLTAPAFDMTKIVGLDIGKLTAPAFDMTKIVGPDIGKLTAPAFDMTKIVGPDIGKLTAPAFDMTKIVGPDIGKLTAPASGIPKVGPIGGDRLSKKSVTEGSEQMEDEDSDS